MSKFAWMAPVYPVQYRFIDGAHFFTSEHPDLKGLCSASTDAASAYADVAVQIEALLRANHQREEHAVPLWSLKKFLRESNQHPMTAYWKTIHA